MDMQISSDYIITAIEQHFKVSAGPGAGKTYWLINHIKNILTCSTRLGKTRAIACLTYSNVAVDAIKERLGTSAQQVEVSTIHSFLYMHIVKPYAFAVPAEYKLDVARMDGHDDVIPSFGKTKEWLENTGQVYIYQDKRNGKDNQAKVLEALKNIRWYFNSNNDLEIVLPKDKFHLKMNYKKNGKNLSIKNNSFIEFKKIYWKDGILSHDDVLFFSYQIVTKLPFVLDILRAKFPYFLIDEFQDTSPIQTAILKLLAAKETIIGVIGDPAQSIYGFQGANEKQFDSFSLPNMQTYTIADNHRSTIQIVDLLNHIRKDMIQNSCKDETGNDKIGKKPILYIGKREEALAKIKEDIKDDFTVLARTNDIVKVVLHRHTGQSENFLKKLKEEDSNDDRKRWIEACVKAVAFAQKDMFKDAIQEFVRLYRREAVKSNTLIDEFQKQQWRKQALKNIQILLANFNTICNKSIADFSNLYLAKSGILEMEISKITKLNVSNQRTFEDHIKCVDIKEDTGNYRTIHKAKGDEFDNVVLILDEEKEIEFLTTPDLSKEEHRIRYVAVSRAKKMLYICVPLLITAPNNDNFLKIQSL